MNSTIRAVAIFATISLSAGSAKAQWVHQETGGAFSESATHLAMTILGSYAFGVRCSDADDLTAIFITPEQVDEETAKMMTAFAPKLLVRVDDNEPFEITATAEKSDKGLSFFTEVPSDLLQQVNGANRRVSVAAQVLGDLFHETEFNVRGSTGTTQMLIDTCRISIE